MRSSVAGIQAQRLADQFDALLRPAGLQRHNASQVQRIGVVRLRTQYAAAYRSSFGEHPLLMQRAGVSKQVLRGVHYPLLM